MDELEAELARLRKLKAEKLTDMLKAAREKIVKLLEVIFATQCPVCWPCPPAFRARLARRRWLCVYIARYRPRASTGNFPLNLIAERAGIQQTLSVGAGEVGPCWCFCKEGNGAPTAVSSGPLESLALLDASSKQRATLSAGPNYPHPASRKRTGGRNQQVVGAKAEEVLGERARDLHVPPDHWTEDLLETHEQFVQLLKEMGNRAAPIVEKVKKREELVQV